MEAIRETIKGVMEGLKAKKGEARTRNPEALFKKALTKKELAHIKFNYFRNGVLGIKVDSSSWLYQFSLKKEKLLDKLQKDSSQVKDLRFNLGG